MGVGRLWSQVKVLKLFEDVKLAVANVSSEARRPSVLVVDANSLAFSLYSRWKLDIVLGGAHADFVARFRAWLAAWKRVGVALVFVFDGGETTALKRETAAAREQDRARRCRRLCHPAVLGRGLPGKSLPTSPFVMPKMVLSCFKRVLAELGPWGGCCDPSRPGCCWYDVCVAGSVASFEAPGDADRFVAAVEHEAKRHKLESLGIVTSDTDFLILPCRGMIRADDIQFEEGGDVCFRRYGGDLFRKRLRIPEDTPLPHPVATFACIAGCDFIKHNTSSYLQQRATQCTAMRARARGRLRRGSPLTAIHSGLKSWPTNLAVAAAFVRMPPEPMQASGAGLLRLFTPHSSVPLPPRSVPVAKEVAAVLQLYQVPSGRVVCSHAEEANDAPRATGAHAGRPGEGSGAGCGSTRALVPSEASSIPLASTHLFAESWSVPGPLHMLDVPCRTILARRRVRHALVPSTAATPSRNVWLARRCGLVPHMVMELLLRREWHLLSVEPAPGRANPLPSCAVVSAPCRAALYALLFRGAPGVMVSEFVSTTAGRKLYRRVAAGPVVVPRKPCTSARQYCEWFASLLHIRQWPLLSADADTDVDVTTSVACCEPSLRHNATSGHAHRTACSDLPLVLLLAARVVVEAWTTQCDSTGFVASGSSRARFATCVLSVAMAVVAAVRVKGSGTAGWTAGSHGGDGADALHPDEDEPATCLTSTTVTPSVAQACDGDGVDKDAFAGEDKASDEVKEPESVPLGVLPPMTAVDFTAAMSGLVDACHACSMMNMVAGEVLPVFDHSTLDGPRTAQTFGRATRCLVAQKRTGGTSAEALAKLVISDACLGDVDHIERSVVALGVVLGGRARLVDVLRAVVTPQPTQASPKRLPHRPQPPQRNVRVKTSGSLPPPPRNKFALLDYESDSSSECDGSDTSSSVTAL